MAGPNMSLIQRFHCMHIIVPSFWQITDFGLSRDLEEDNYYISRGGMIPVRWTALEVKIYTCTVVCVNKLLCKFILK